MAPDFSDTLASPLYFSWQLTAVISLLAGIATHHIVFRPFEIDGYAWHLFFISLGAILMLTISYIHTAGYGIIVSLFRTLLVTCAYNSGTLISILIYRAFFHPLNRYPGPFLAKLSRFYAMKNAAKNVKAYEDIQKLHQEYGDIVRVGKSI